MPDSNLHPSAVQFSEYANSIDDALRELDKRYPPYDRLPFENSERFRAQVQLITGQYSRDFDRATKAIQRDNPTVSSFWSNDPAYRLALKKTKLPVNGDTESSAATVAWQAINYVLLEGFDFFVFNAVREQMEKNLEWQLGLSKFACRYLDGSLYRGAMEAREHVIEARALAERLSTLLESDGLRYLTRQLPNSAHYTVQVMGDLQDRLPLLVQAIDAPEVEAVLKHRKDEAVLSRLVASELLVINYATFRDGRKDLVQLLSSLGFLDEDIEIEAKTIERVWNRLSSDKRNLANHLFSVRDNEREVLLDRRSRKKRRFSDPRV